MTTTDLPASLDVLVVGAGLSGIGAARYLRTKHPAKTFAVLEARDASGGTWDQFTYPGVRSDSDLHTFGYDFRPWVAPESIADGDQILDYIRQTAADEGVDRHIRYRHRVRHAAWSTAEGRWTVTVEVGDAGDGPVQIATFSARWIFCAAGYYRYDEGYTPTFHGRDSFDGQIVHPQHWPADLDHSGTRVVVIGSGATAMTLVPAMASGPGAARHVTMLQRTPTYVAALPRVDRVGLVLSRLLGERAGYRLTRQKNIVLSQLIWRLARRHPERFRAALRRAQIKALPEGFDVDTHFNPPYDPWDQRLCVVPDGDLFAALGSGAASVVTDTIASFTPTGVALSSGTHLEADIIVTATGLNLQLLGGIALEVDGEAVDPSQLVAYRGMMLSGVPNLAFAIGYTNSSWTLKIGLLCEQFCRLLQVMDEQACDIARADPDPSLGRRPLLDFGAGYVTRALDDLPSQGDRQPWTMSMSYHEDLRQVRGSSLPDRFLTLSRSGVAAHRTSASPVGGHREGSAA